MKKLLTIITLLCFSVAVNAQQPNWVSLTDTINEALDESNSPPEISSVNRRGQKVSTIA